MKEVPEPVIRMRKDHNISRRGIDPDALKVLYRLARYNHTAYLVGGGVRDLLLGREPKDFDVSTNAHPNQIKKIFRNCFLIGRRFRLAHIKYGTKVIETSTFRRKPEQNGDDDSLFQSDDNTFGTPAEDALRRDFTINGLFYDIENFSVIDYVGGLRDLDERKVRAIGDPDIRFREDPVRMIRAVRFASRLGFEIEEETYAAIIRHHEEIAKASPPRMLEEIYRLYAYSSGEAAFRLLKKTKLMEVMFPEVTRYLKVTGEEQSILWKHLAALDDGKSVVPTPTPALMFGALFYAPLCTVTEEARKNNGNNRQNDEVRNWLAPIASRYQFPRKVVDRLVRITTSQHRFENGKRRRFSKSRFASHDSFPETLALCEIDRTAKDEDLTNLEEWRELLKEAEEKRKASGKDEQPSSRRRNRRRPRPSRRRQPPNKDATPKESQAPEEQNQQSKPAESETRTAAPSKKRRRRRSQRGRRKNGNAQASAAKEVSKQASEPKPDEAKAEKARPSENQRAKSGFEQDERAPHWLDEI